MFRVLVTGGAGCIGIEVCKELAARGITTRLFDLPEQVRRTKGFIPLHTEVFLGSILDRSSLRDAMEDCDTIIHLAAYLGVQRTEENRLRCIEVNVDGTKNILDCAVQNRVNKIVFASSSEVYGEPSKNPITEDFSTQGKSVYAVTKLVGEELCKAYSQRYPELSHVILRYFNTYGLFQITQFVIPKFIENVINDKPPVIYGDGEQLRSYCYASDTARATVDVLLGAKADGQVLNIGNGNAPISLIDLADTVIRVCGKNMKPEYKNFINADRTKEREIFVRYCDTTRAREILDFVPRVSLEEGIRKIAGKS